MIVQMPALTPPVGLDDHAQGPAAAPVTLVECGNFECPDCGKAFPIVKVVQQQFGDQLRFVYRHFPLTQVHPHAERAAEASEAAAAQDAFWPMHDMLFEHKHALGDVHLVAYAGALGLDVDLFVLNLTERSYADRVREQFLCGVRSVVNGAPTFFIHGVCHDYFQNFVPLSFAIKRGAGRRTVTRYRGSAGDEEFRVWPQSILSNAFARWSTSPRSRSIYRRKSRRWRRSRRRLRRHT